MTDRQPLSTEPYKGVRDFYPADWGKMQALFNRTRELLASYGYEEYNASPLERAELYESKGNEEIVNEQTYTFTDRGDRRVTLRPEMTPSLARMVAAKRRELTYPLRWFSIGNRFRYERMQKGRLREFYQTDIDLVGLPEGEADLEMVTLAHDLLIAFGASEADFSIHVNSRKLLRLASEVAGLAEGEHARHYWQLIDRKSKMSKEEFESARKEFTADPLAVIEAGTDAGVAAEKARLESFIETLKARSVGNAVLDLDVVRGFDYYTGTVFEIFDTNPENARSLFGGGRYDGLVTLFGGDPIPAVGFAFGDVTLMDFLTTHGYAVHIAASADIYVGTPSPEDLPAARSFADELRKSGVRVFMNLAEKSLGDQVKEAVKRGIPYFAAFGKNEAETGTVRLKTLATSSEEEIPRGEVAARVMH
ncbi:MAG TPA: histidine--tRNA ligase [Candidatus Paceibacterota bacterium]|nr:histidine--tRNA ligase [Candidatus Paceibacterota bacterium]